MKSVRLKNLRSFVDTGTVPMKSINIFVGQNSSGKSTFLRTFLLLRQSILRETRGPILWYDESFVDFGSYDESKNRYTAKENGIQLEFDVEIESTSNYLYHYFRSTTLKEGTIINVSIEIFSDTGGNDFIRKVILKFDNQEIYLKADSIGNIKELSINDESILDSNSSYKFQKTNISGIIPNLFRNKDESKNDPIGLYWERDTDLYDDCKEFIKKTINRSNVKDETVHRILAGLEIGSKEHVLSKLRSHEKPSWIKKIKLWDVQTKEFNELNILIIRKSLSNIFSSVDEKLRASLQNCQYIAPIRAKAIRYYRRQNLSVSEIDAYGDNMHMFLDNLTKTQRDKYQYFVRRIFSFIPEIESSKGHIAINIKEKNGEKFNITDLGFGFSQILPIITKLWYASYMTPRVKNRVEEGKRIITLLIEQPELHLHPAMQAQLADAFIIAVEEAHTNGNILRLVIETHSSVIINRIGRRVTEKNVKPEDINIAIFEPDQDQKTSSVKVTGFNEKGVLKNWPLGFFEPNNY